jgi:hypothetical protein
MKALPLLTIISLSLMVPASAQEVSAKPTTTQSSQELEEMAMQGVDSLIRAAQVYNALPESVRRASGPQSVRGAYDLLLVHANKRPDLVLDDELSVNMEWALVLSDIGKLRSAPLLNTLVNQIMAEAADAEGRRTAQSLSSVFTAGVAMGSKELADVKTVEEAIERLNSGAKGAGVFEGKPIICKTTPEEAAAAKIHLEYDLSQQILRYTHKATIIKVPVEDPNALAPDAIEVLAKLFETKREAEVHDAKRAAQNLVSSFNSAVEGGTKDFDNVTTLGEVIDRLNAGVMGGGAFADKQFKCKTRPEQIRPAKRHLQLDVAKKVLLYSPEPVRNEVSPAAIKAATISSAEARLIAQRLASVFAAAMATGTKELDAVTTVERALERLHVGIKGAGPFVDTVFTAKTTPEQAEAAKPHLRFDQNERTLLYTPKTEKTGVSGGAPGANSIDLDRLARRNAQSLYSTYLSAQHAGCEALKKAKTVEKIHSLLSKGINGVGPWRQARFSVVLSEKDMKAAAPFLNWGAATGLTYLE